MANMVYLLHTHKLHHIASETSQYGATSAVRPGTNHVGGEPQKSILQNHQGNRTTVSVTAGNVESESKYEGGPYTYIPKSIVAKKYLPNKFFKLEKIKISISKKYF